jgi:hypothetical protein
LETGEQNIRTIRTIPFAQFLEQVAFHQTMKLTFDLNISPRDLAEALAGGKAGLQISGYLHFEEDGKTEQVNDTAEQVNNKEDVSEEGSVTKESELTDTNKKIDAFYSDEVVAAMRLSDVQGLPYRTLQMNLKERGVGAGGKHVALASRLHSAAQSALEDADETVASFDENAPTVPFVAMEAKAKKAIMEFDDEHENFEEDYALSQDVYMMCNLRDSLDNASTN